MAFKHYAIELPEDISFDLIAERVQHALDTGREIGETNDYHDGLEGEQIAAADAFVDMCRDSNINPLTGSEDDSPFAFMDSDEGDDPDEDWNDFDEDSEEGSEDW